MSDQVQAIINAHSPKPEEIIPILHDVQERGGHLSRAALLETARHTRMPEASAYGVATFYDAFRAGAGAPPVLVCQGPVCRHRGAEQAMAALDERGAAYTPAPCLGLCEHAPAALHGDRPVGELTPDKVDDFLHGRLPQPTALVYGRPRLATARIGQVDPASLSDYEAQGGFQALRRALAGPPEAVIEAVEASGIVGRGGAMFPTGRKWRFTRGAPGSVKHLVVNADESEPGTFKDRIFLEEDPFAVIEAAALAGYAIGAANGWIFIRGEYPRGYARLQTAIQQARAAGYLGQNILGTGFQFDIELRRGAGAYICGEETALFEAIEGKRGYPRTKPPFPTTHGLFGQPTAINNVETLIAAMTAFGMGIDEWRKLGTAQSPGTKLFCLSGDVARPGVYELPFGVTVRELIELGGGSDGRSLQAVLMGGAAGKFIGPGLLDMPLTYEDARANHIPLGSGVVMVFDEKADLRRVLYDIAHFFDHESCGQCFPCRMGTRQQADMWRRIAFDGHVRPTDKQLLFDIGAMMTKTSLCGLGQTAASAVMSAIDLWPDLVDGRQ
ncbi:MAG: NAD(P)H-dependent oxidoreductase subunit E [Anaerolineae bacterium]